MDVWGGVYRRWGKVGRWGRYVCGRGRHCACRRQRRGVHLRARSPVGTAGEAGTLRRAALGVGRGVPGARPQAEIFLTYFLLTYLLTYLPRLDVLGAVAVQRGLPPWTLLLSMRCSGGSFPVPFRVLLAVRRSAAVLADELAHVHGSDGAREGGFTSRRRDEFLPSSRVHDDSMSAAHTARKLHDAWAAAPEPSV